MQIPLKADKRLAHRIGRAQIIHSSSSFLKNSGSLPSHAADAAVFHDTPTGGSQQRVNQFGAGFGFVHGLIGVVLKSLIY